MADLRTIEGPHAGGVFPLDRESAVLGRHPDCDIVLDSGAVSRQHARIQRVDNKFYIEDMQSRNGTYVNGRQIRERYLLSDQDRITLCDVVMIFHDDSGEREARRQPRTPSSILETTALMVDDEAAEDNSTVMTRMDISSGSSSLRLEVNPHAKLKALMEISRNLGRAVALNEVLPKVLDSLLTIFPQADRGVMVLRDAATGKLVPRALKHRRPELVDTVRISRTIVQGVMASKEAILSADASSDIALQGLGEHRRLPHPLRDVRAVDQQPGRRDGRHPDRHFRSTEPLQPRRSGSPGERCLPGGHRRGERGTARDGHPRPEAEPRVGGRPRRAPRVPAVQIARGSRATTSSISTNRPTNWAATITTTFPCPAGGWRWSWPTCRAKAFPPRC